MASHILDENLLHLKRSAFSHSNTQRSYQACTPCRNSKLKCVTLSPGPDCTRCHKKGFECAWAAARTQRGCEKISKLKVLKLPIDKGSSRNVGTGKTRRQGSRFVEKQGRLQSQVTPLLLDLPSHDDSYLTGSNVSSSELTIGIPADHVSQRVDIVEHDGNHGSDEGACAAQANSLLFDRWHESFDGILGVPFNTQGDFCMGDAFPSLQSVMCYSSSTEIIQARRKALTGSGSCPSELNLPSSDDSTSHHLWEGIATMLKHMRKLLFPSKSQTTKIIKDKTYVSEILKFQPRLRGWKRDFHKIDVPVSIRHVILAEFEYANVYLHSIILEATTMSLVPNSHMHGSNRTMLRALVTSCRNVLQVINDGIVQGGSLIYAPTRTYLRILATVTILLKASKLLEEVEEVATNLQWIKQAVSLLRASEGSVAQTLVPFSDAIDSLLESLLPEEKSDDVRMRTSLDEGTSTDLGVNERMEAFKNKIGRLRTEIYVGRGEDAAPKRLEDYNNHMRGLMDWLWLPTSF